MTRVAGWLRAADIPTPCGEQSYAIDFKGRKSFGEGHPFWEVMPITHLCKERPLLDRLNCQHSRYDCVVNFPIRIRNYNRDPTLG